MADGDVGVSLAERGLKESDLVKKPKLSWQEQAKRVIKIPAIFRRNQPPPKDVQVDTTVEAGSPPLSVVTEEPKETLPILPIAPPIDTEAKYDTVVETMETPLMKMCEQLKSHFEEDEYGLILGDDTSGRLPTLVIREVSDFISDIYQREPVPTVFVQASSIIPTEAVAQQFAQRVLTRTSEMKGKRALLVTEFIESGNVMQRLLSLFDQHGIPVDVAVLKILTNSSGQRPIASRDSLFFVGEEKRVEYDSRGVTTAAPPTFGKEFYSGIKKPTSADEPITLMKERYPEAQEYINAARKDIKILSSKIIQQLYYTQDK